MMTDTLAPEEVEAAEPAKNNKPKLPTVEELEAKNEAPWKTAPDTEPYIDEVGLFDNVKSFIKRHVYFRDPILYDVVTAWIFATYHMKKWRALGILLLTGPIGSGKTTGLEILEEVAYRGVRSGSMSNPVQFRMREDHQPTFLIDEAQLYNQDDWAELRGALNESYKRGGKVWRMIGEGSTLTYKSFKVYGATALALSDQPWEAMEARGLKIKMEKVPREERTRFKETLTDEFYQQGAKLRGQLKQYRTRFEKLQPPETDLDKLIEKIEAAKTPAEKSSLVINPFPDPTTSLEEVTDPRIREIGYPLVVVAPDTGPRDNIVRYLKDLEAAHQADENTGYTGDIFRAFSQAGVEGGKVSISDVRAQLMIIWDIEKLTDKRMPHPKTVMNALKTMGFNATRTSQNKAAVFYDPDLVKGLATRYGVTSSSSGSSGANGANGANQEGSRGRPLRDQIQKVMESVTRLTSAGDMKFVTAPTILQDTGLDLATVETTFVLLEGEGLLVQDPNHTGHFRPNIEYPESPEGP